MIKVLSEPGNTVISLLFIQIMCRTEVLELVIISIILLCTA